MSDLISREEVLRRARPEYLNPQQEKLSSYNQGWNNALDEYSDRIKALSSAEPESFEDERKKIADALSEKMAYMNTCLNERDIILSYLGVKRPIGTHCNSDCRNEKCESYHYATKELPSAGPERMKGKWIRITQGTMPGQYMCPFCHRTIENYGVEELLSIRYPYCHCGADMRDEEE